MEKTFYFQPPEMVGAIGFEPTTPGPPDRFNYNKNSALTSNVSGLITTQNQWVSGVSQTVGGA